MEEMKHMKVKWFAQGHAVMNIGPWAAYLRPLASRWGNTSICVWLKAYHPKYTYKKQKLPSLIQWRGVAKTSLCDTE